MRNIGCPVVVVEFVYIWYQNILIAAGAIEHFAPKFLTVGHNKKLQGHP